MKKIIEKLKAFTLIELLVAIVGISLLSAAMAPVITKQLKPTKSIVNAAELRTKPYCDKFCTKCQMCYPQKCMLCKETCGEIQTNYGKTSSILDKENCRCQLCNSGTPTTTRECTPVNVTSDPYCYSCQLEGKKCLSCMPGYYLKNGKCEPCAAGKKCSGGMKDGKPAEPEDCPAGTYQDKTGQSTCKDCEKGHKCPGTGMKDQESCPSGEYQDLTKQTTCKKCSIGTANNTTGRKTSCEPCEPGTTAATEGCTACTKCSAGSYSASTSECKKCAKGYYSSSAGWAQCSACKGGTYAANTGMTSCATCSAGTYAKGTANSACTDCAAGTYQSNPGKESCSNCNSGKYQDEAGKASCDTCPEGKYSGTSGAWTSCSTCANGTYASSSAQSSCAACSIDGCKTYSKTACSCTKCKGGYKLVNGKCEVCPAGKYSTEGSTSCTSCESGKYSSEKATSCSECDKKCQSYSKKECKCTACTSGQKLSNGDCVACADGYYQDENPTTDTSCKACSSKTANCTKCNKKTGVCTACASGYVLDSSNKCVLDKIVPKKQADCDLIAGNSDSLCYVKVGNTGYCVTTNNIIKSDSQFMGSAAGNTCVIGKSTQPCHWTKTSGNKSAYLSNKGAASGVCDAYEMENTNTFKDMTKDVIEAAYNKSACNMIRVGNMCSDSPGSGGKGYCESDHNNHDHDGECCYGNYFFYGISNKNMNMYDPENNTSATNMINKGTNVRCMLTEGKRATN